MGENKRQLSFLSSSTHTGTHRLGVQLQNSVLCVLWPGRLPASFLICTMGVCAHPQRPWGGPGSCQEDAPLGGFGVCVLQNRREDLPRSHKPGWPWSSLPAAPQFVSGLRGVREGSDPHPDPGKGVEGSSTLAHLHLQVSAAVPAAVLGSDGQPAAQMGAPGCEGRGGQEGRLTEGFHS